MGSSVTFQLVSNSKKYETLLAVVQTTVGWVYCLAIWYL